MRVSLIVLAALMEALTAIAYAVAEDRAVSSGRNDVVYLAAATEPYEALPLGNGRIGVMVRNQGGMTYVFNPGNFFASADQNQLLISSGELTLRLPEAWLQGFVEERLALYDGKVVTQFKTGDDTHTVTSWLAEGLDVLVIEIESTAVLPELDAELWVWPREGYGNSGVPETKRVATAGQIALTTVGLSKARATALLVEPLARDATNVKIDGERAILTIPSASRKSVTLLAANPVVVGKEVANELALSESRAVLEKARNLGLDSLRTQRDEYWHDFWSKSSIVMHSDDGLADYVENLYHLFQYWMAGSSRGPDAPKFNGSNYTFYKDWRSWGGQYWYQNTREMYWSLLPAGHGELWAPFVDLYSRNLPAFKKLAQDSYGVDGACVQETMGRDGSGDKDGNPYTCLYLTTGTEVAHQFYQYYLFTRDEKFLAEKAYPFMKETVTFHLNFVNREDDGLFHVYPSNARETYWWVKDSTPDLTALKTILPMLIATSERLNVDAKERVHWKEVLAHLAPFVTKGDAFAPAQFLDEFPKTRFAKAEIVYDPTIPGRRTTLAKGNGSNAENVACEPLYPWGLIHLDSPADELERMRATFRRRPFNSWTFGNAWDTSALAAARLGLVDDVVKCLGEYARNLQMFPNGAGATPAALPEIWGKQVPDYLAFDSAGVLAATAQEMQLQSFGGRIRVFPAWPKSWQSEFTLVAEGDFLVSSRIQADGRIPSITILSRQGGACNVVSPWHGAVTVEEAGKLRSLGSGSLLKLTTTAGKTYELRPQNVFPDDAPLVTTKNAGPKWPFREGAADTAESYLQRTHTHGFLGIARDGQSPMRNRVRRATSEDIYPNPPQLLLSADFDQSLDALAADGTVKAQGDGAKRTTGGSGAPKSQPNSEAADFGYRSDPTSVLRYDAPGHIDPKQGTISFWVKTNWDWDPAAVKGSPTLVTIPLPPHDHITVYAYMHPSGANVGLTILEEGKQHGSYHRVNWKKDEWHHIAATWNGWRTQLFIDGQRVDRQYWAESTQELKHKPPTIFVGGAVTGNASEVLIDDLQIWDQPLTRVVPPGRQ